MLANREGPATAYDVLGVHPNAPADLIAASYWFLVGSQQKRRDQGEYVGSALHELTRAYELVSDPARRSEYDAAIGHAQEPLAKRRLPSTRRSLRSRLFSPDVIVGPLNHYEVLGISATAPSEILSTAHQVMRVQYLRVPPGSEKRLQLLKALDDAYAVLSIPEKRKKYDERTIPKAAERRAEPSVSEVSPLPRASRGPVLPGLAGVLSSGARLPYRALSIGWRALLAGRATRPTDGVPAERPVRPSPPPERPITREPAPRPRAQAVDVEEALLGRLASYVKEIQSLHLSSEPRERRDGPRNSQP